MFVHAGVRPGIPMELQDPHDLIWIRHEFFMSDHGLKKTVVFGHTPFRGEPFVGEKMIGIDTGAVLRGDADVSGAAGHEVPPGLIRHAP